MEFLESFLDASHAQYMRIAVHEASKLFLAAFLGVMLSFRRKPDRYRLSLIEAHALLAMAGAMFMVIISGEMIRAVALLGAASIVRYRYAITNARDASTLILSLGVGMGCGSNLMVQVTAGTVLILIVGRLLAYFPEVMPFATMNRREQMVLKIFCEDYDRAMNAVSEAFDKNDVRYQVVAYDLKFRKLDAQEVSEVSFEVSMATDINLHELSKQILGQGVTRLDWQRTQSI